ncbi:MAG: HEAT repeat domain-containing protein [Xanthomonadales bacterium]|nr:HEAT repeat domain-containing protein [Xanthomonadales bacterium]MDH4019444.1 HEAT repeat domain-containing protein [Xanthomonadales bacterium]
MKTYWLSLALMVLSGNSWALTGELYNADVTDNTSVTNPARAMQEAEGQWLAFSLPALEGTRSPCCWKGKWSGMGEAGCSLESKHQSYGTRSDSPLAENVIVFSQVRDGKVEDLRVVGESCPVDANGAEVTWIGSVDERAGLDWLEAVARSGQDDSALYALALHKSPDAGQRLYTLAKDTEGELSEEAIFWLGESRGDKGFSSLKQLLAELPRGHVRRSINFALAQNSSTAAADLLFEVSQSDSDPEQRGEAMFWLAEGYPQQAQGWLLELVETEKDEDVLEQAVFAISQLPDGAGDQVLLELAKDSQTPRAVRRQAIFWLAQSDNDSSVAALTELLTR